MADVSYLRLLMKHRTALYAYLYACVRNHADAEDLLQDVSVAVMESSEQLDNEANFLPWAREIARRRILSHWRSGKREKATDPGLLLSLAEAAERVEEQQSTPAHRDALLGCLEKLPPQSRRILMLRYEDSQPSILKLAEKLNRTTSATYALVKRIKASLRECVQRHMAQEGVS